MNTQQLISEFLASDHGAQATQALAAQEIGEADAQRLLHHAVGAAADHVEAHHAGLLGEHPGRNFFAAFAAGLVRGDGFFKSLADGGEGVIIGRMAEAMAARTGMDAGSTSTIAATLTPYVLGFLKQRLG